MPCPVIANGHVYSAAQAQDCWRAPARAADDRRGVIRSPWLFNQIRQQLRGEAVTAPTGARSPATFARCGNAGIFARTCIRA
jgi:tRNA-dihydrouridine synthase